MARILMLIFLILPLSACLSSNQQLEIELRRSLKNFVASVDERHVEGLQISVFFPETSDYKKHVQSLLINYLEELRDGKEITFDDQGVVLTRFIGMLHHNYLVKSIETIDDRNVRMRMSFKFSYDNNIRQANFEKGTKVYVPGDPWGTTHLIEVGVDAPAPRLQISYAEVVVEMRKTNHEGYWQVRTCKVDEDSLEFEQSFETEFYSGD